ncbi:MAG: hypothetical protein KA973_18045 [Candidatus Microthrix sp.]|nr:hypothetical protein [Candidatus Microthrix sp.]
MTGMAWMPGDDLDAMGCQTAIATLIVAQGGGTQGQPKHPPGSRRGFLDDGAGG